jgi:uncharacterized phosphosugar-binding protein
MNQTVIGIDLGGTWIKGVLMDTDTGEIIKQLYHKKLDDFADLILDTGAPIGDAMITVPGLNTPVAPGSMVGGAVLINSIKAEVARLLTEAGQPPKVLSAGVVVGAERAVELFEGAYDEHAHRLAKLYEKVGIQSYVSGL